MLKFAEFIEKQAKAYGFNLPPRSYDIYTFAKDLLAWLEKQNEQKSTDKIEPKFKVGDWIVFNKGKGIYKVEKIENYEYTLRHILGGSMPLSFSGEGLIRKWTIEDAKDGDVLCCKSSWMCILKDINNQTKTFSSYCFMDSDKCFLMVAVNVIHLIKNLLNLIMEIFIQLPMNNATSYSPR